MFVDFALTRCSVCGTARLPRLLLPRLLGPPIVSKLSLFLPHPVDSDEGKAQFDSDKDTLSVTLPIVRDDW